MRHYLGIDVGTSSTKTTLADEKGRIVATASQAYACVHPRPGWSEQDPRQWYEAAVVTVREAISRAGIGVGLVEGISFGGQMHGLVALDANDVPVRPAILWNDGRSTEECDYLNDEVGSNVLTQACANIAFPGFTAPKLLWMRRHEPEAFARISKVMLPKDYLAYRMSGRFVTDVSDASGTLLFDIAHRCWSGPMVELVGLRLGQLPEVHESWEAVGTLTMEAARDLGLEERVRVIAGAGDNAAAAVGMGTVAEGQCNISLGTSGTVFLPTARLHVAEGNTLHAFADATGAYHLMGCILSAALANSWWVERVLGSGYAEEAAGIADESLGRNRVVFLPYLMGERSPINDVAARAVFVGMDADTSRNDLTQAVMEGVAFALRQCLGAAGSMGVFADRLTVCGGGAKSVTWLRILASVIGRPLRVLESGAGPGYGACLLAMVGSGAYGDVASAARACVPSSGRIIEPVDGATERYESRYRAYCALYPALRTVFPLLEVADD